MFLGALPASQIERLRADRAPLVPALVGHAAVAAFSLAIYHWAIRVGLPTAKIERLISAGAHETAVRPAG